LDAVSLIVNALTSGAARGVADSTADAVKDAYSKLRHLVSGWFAENRTAAIVLAEHGNDPSTWQAPLSKALAESGASEDPAVMEAAQRVMALLDEVGSRAGKYHVDLRHASGVVVGEGNQQVNVFNAGPGLAALPDPMG
jgi:hypothetical protein